MKEEQQDNVVKSHGERSSIDAFLSADSISFDEITIKVEGDCESPVDNDLAEFKICNKTTTKERKALETPRDKPNSSLKRRKSAVKSKNSINEKTVRRHEKGPIGKPSSSLERCESAVKSKNTVKGNMTMDNGKVLFDLQCFFCSEMLNNYTEFNDHLRDNHQQHIKTESVFTCEHCSDKYISQWFLNAHIKDKHGLYLGLIDNDLPVSEAAKSTTGDDIHSNLNDETISPDIEMSNATQSTEPVSLNNANSRSIFNSGIFGRVARVTRVNGSYKCKFCSLKFLSRKVLIRHMKTLHENGFCYFCGKIVNNVRDHMRRSHELEKRHSCKICGQNFLEQSALITHMRKIHLLIDFMMGATISARPNYTKNKRRHICQECGAGYMDLHSFQFHITSHTGERPHECSFCKKTFRTQLTLKRHINGIHNMTGISFDCPHCYKSYNTYHQRRDHIRRVHSTRFRATCEYCGKKFKSISEHRTHLRMHTGEKPFQCETCERKFAYRSHRNDHQKKCAQK